MPELALQITAAVGEFWFAQGHWAELETACEKSRNKQSTVRPSCKRGARGMLASARKLMGTQSVPKSSSNKALH